MHQGQPANPLIVLRTMYSSIALGMVQENAVVSWSSEKCGAVLGWRWLFLAWEKREGEKKEFLPPCCPCLLTCRDKAGSDGFACSVILWTTGSWRQCFPFCISMQVFLKCGLSSHPSAYPCFNLKAGEATLWSQIPLLPPGQWAPLDQKAAGVKGEEGWAKEVLGENGDPCQATPREGGIQFEQVYFQHSHIPLEELRNDSVGSRCVTWHLPRLEPVSLCQGLSLYRRAKLPAGSAALLLWLSEICSVGGLHAVLFSCGIQIAKWARKCWFNPSRLPANPMLGTGRACSEVFH